MARNGKGTIVSDDGAGLYTVQVVQDDGRVLTAISQTQTTISKLSTTLIPAAQTSLATANSQLATDRAALNAAIDGGDLALIKEASSAVRVTSISVASYNRQLNNYQLNLLSANKRLTWLNTYTPTPVELPLWCGDHSVGLSGNVALIYPNNDPSQTPIVAPDADAQGDPGLAVWDAAVDGIQQPAIAATPAGCWLNQAVQPAAQKNLGTYRLGIITFIDADTDTCSVTLDAATGAQGIDLNVLADLTGVAITYMSCNAQAFEVDDRVVVQFDSDQTNPRVVGFESNPRGCSLPLFAYGTAGGESTGELYAYSGGALSLISANSSGDGYLHFMYDGVLWAWEKTTGDNFVVSSTSGSYEYYLGAGAGNSYEMGPGYLTAAQLTDTHCCFAWLKETNQSSGVNIRIYNKETDVLEHSWNADFPFCYHIRAQFSQTHVLIWAHRWNGTNDGYMTKLYTLDGTFVAELQNIAVHGWDYTGINGFSFNGSRRDMLALTQDRAYVGVNVFDMDGASKGSVPTRSDVNGQNALDRPSAWGALAANETTLGMITNHEDYDPYYSGDGKANYYQWQISKGGPGFDDTYTQISTGGAGINVDNGPYYVGVMRDFKGL